ncbi:MAG: alpha/beta fold hydrolase [Chloroflexi bacterium]|nr:alpha/beta fold hydrolase [Chloroflexota bacterium]
MLHRIVGLVVFLFSSFLFASPLLATPPAQVQRATLAVLDRSNSPISKLTDGDFIKLSVKTAAKADKPTRVSFSFDTESTSIAECTIQAGSDGCQTELFPTLGWYWSQDGQPRVKRLIRVNSAELPGSETTEVQVAARPVVLLYGLQGSSDDWHNYTGSSGFLTSIGLRGYAVGDGQVAGDMNTGRREDPTGRANTLAENAAIVGQYIAQVKNITHAQQVDLIGYSMGGLIARYYIDRVMQDRDVAQLITLGTPHSGTECANLPAALNYYLPATLEITPAYLRDIFNRQITHQRGIQFYLLAGTVISDPVKAFCTSVPNDLMVSRSSVTSIQGQVSQLPLTHLELTFSDLVFANFVKPLLQKPPNEFAVEPDRVLSEETQPELQFSRTYTGHVDRGTSQEQTIHIDNVTVASFALFDPTNSLTVTVRGAAGNVIQLDPVKNGLTVIDDPLTLVHLGYGFSNPRPGPWRITVQATDQTPSGGADYALSAQFRGNAILRAKTSNLLPKLGETVELTGRLELGGKPLTADTVTAYVLRPDGKNVTIAMVRSGDGFNANWTPEIGGIHGIQVVGRATTPDGVTIERSAFLAVQVQPSALETIVRESLGLGVIVLIAVVSVAAIIFLGVRTIRRFRKLGS